ncbi:MAG: hypothetical protein K2G93_04695, partial [Rikenella sp.]|nr:hypothetical protein [Rikenella sp.]
PRSPLGGPFYSKTSLTALGFLLRNKPRPSVARIAASPSGGPVPLGTRKLEFAQIGSAERLS